MIYEEKSPSEHLSEQEFMHEINRKFDLLDSAFSGLKNVDERVQASDRYEDLTTNDLLMYIEVTGIVNYLFRGELKSKELVLTSSLSGV